MTFCVLCSTVDRRVEAPAHTYACDACSTIMLRHLRQLEYCLLALSAVPTVGEPGIKAPGFGSASPARDDVIVAIDPRSAFDEHADNPMGKLISTCQMVAEERHVTPVESAHPSVVCEYLRRHHGWITARTWVDEYAAELATSLATVRRLLGLAPEAPQGRCWVLLDDRECGGPLWWTDDRDALHCGTCGRVYSGAELLRYQVGQEASA